MNGSHMFSIQKVMRDGCWTQPRWGIPFFSWCWKIRSDRAQGPAAASLTSPGGHTCSHGNWSCFYPLYLSRTRWRAKSLSLSLGS